MAYPGQYVNTHKGPESPYFALMRSQAPPVTNTGPNNLAVNVPLISTNQPLLTTSQPPQTALRTTVSPMASLQGSLYSPQPVKQISLKTGFTMPVSDDIATLQQHKLPSEVANPEYLNDDALLDILITEITESSSLQETCIRSRYDLLARAQEMSLTLWKISTSKVQVNLRCADMNEVSAQVNTQSVEFNQEQANAFQAVVRKIHEINTVSASDSMFSQTANEIALSRLVHHFSLIGDVPSLKKAFAKIASVLGRSSHMSSQTVDVLRGLLYFTGIAVSRISSSSDPIQKVQENVDMLNLNNLVADSSDSNLNGSKISSEDSLPLSLFLLQHILNANSLQWASTLMSPTIDDVLLHKWLTLAFESKYLANMQEIEIIKLLSQVPWYQFAEMSPNGGGNIDILTSTIHANQRRPSTLKVTDPQYLEIIKVSILVPIQAAIALAAGKNFVAALVLCSKILALVSRTAPAQLTASCIGILLRAPWPAKMTSVPAFQLFDWNSLDGATLVLLFGEIYHLFQLKPLEYSAASRPTRVEHRDAFANYVVSNQPMMALTYQVDPSLARINYQRSYPIFFILAHIALSALKFQQQASTAPNLLLSASVDAPALAFDLPRVIVEELFHFASAWVPVSNNPNYQFQRNMLGLVRAEAHDALQRVCQEDPRLYSHVLHELLQNMNTPGFELSTGIKQLQPQLMIVDEGLVNTIAYLMCRRSFDSLPPSNSPTFRTAAAAMAETIMADVGPERVTDQLAWPVATYLFANVLWYTASPLIRCKAILLLLSLRNVRGAPSDAQDWILTMLGRLLSPNFLRELGPLSIDLILSQLQSSSVDHAASQTVRIVIALNAVKTAIDKTEQKTENASMNRFNYSWLWDSFKLKTMLDQLITSLKKLPATMITVATPKASYKEHKPISLTSATDALNSLAASATNAIFGIGASTSQKQQQIPLATQSPLGIRTTHQLLLLQRVAYHYAHCIKYSPGQLQREVSVLFNVLVDQLEAFQKGSGIRLLEELFTESMAPPASELTAAQAETRQLWLNFWVYALIPRVPQWSTSEALANLLDTFSYAAFFSQARFGEMVSLLPTVKEKGGLKASDEAWLPTRHIVPMLIQRQQYWLVYLLLWAYGPIAPTDCYRLTPDQAKLDLPPLSLRDSPLWKWFEAASDRYTPPHIALIYWERFFWTYFEAGAQLADFDFLPVRWKSMMTNLLIRVGSALANPGVTFTQSRTEDLIPASSEPTLMNQLYMRLVSWNKMTIFVSGAFLFQPHLLPPDAPEAGLLAELQASVAIPAVFTTPYDANQFDAVAQKPFPPLPAPESPDAIVELLPRPKSDASVLFAHESNLNRTYLAELERNYLVINTPIEHKGDEFNPRHPSEVVYGTLPILDDVEVWSVQLKDLDLNMAECDDREFGMLKTLWKLTDKSIPLSLPCSERCSGPARSAYVVKTAVLSDPNSTEVIQRIRAEFQDVYKSYIDALKSLSTATVLLEDLCRLVIDSNSAQRDAQCTFLFFEILPLLINQTIRDTSPLYARLLKSGLLLGREVIQSKPSRDHMKFFKMILEGTKRPNSSNPNALGVSSSSPRVPLFELFTPTCFIPPDGDHSVFAELLYIFVKTPHDLSDDEEVAIASQFNLVQTLPTLVEHHLTRLFDVLELAALRSALIEFVKLAITCILNRHATMASSQVDLLGDAPSTSSTTPNTPIIERIVRLVLIACPHSPMLGSWEMMKDDWLGPFVLPAITSVLPSDNGAVISSAVALVLRVTGLASFNMQTDFELLLKFFKSLFSNATRSPLLGPKNRAAFMAGFELLVARCSPSAIWPIYLNVLTPFFAHNSGSDFSQALDILCGAKWSSLQTHLYDAEFVVHLASLPLFHLPLVRTIFSNINWIEYEAKTRRVDADLLGSENTQEEPKIPAKMIHFLQLFCKMNLLAPSYIDPALKKMVISVSKQPTLWYQDGKHLFDWREANPADFAHAFRGDTLVSMVRFLAHSQRTHDPADDFEDNVQLLNDVCRHSGSVEAIEVCLEEIKSCLFFFCPSTNKGSIWHLPLHANVEFVSNYMIPLTQQYHQMQAERCTLPPKPTGEPRMIYHQCSYDALVSLLSTAHTLPSSEATSSPLATNSTQASLYTARLHFIDAVVPFYSKLKDGSLSTNTLFQRDATEASAIIRGLVVRLMGTLDADLSLAVLHVASRAFPSNYLTLVGVWEEALRSYFIQSTFADQLVYATNALTVPEVNHLNELLVPCGEMKCPLGMRILLEREKQDWINLPPQRYSEKFVAVLPQLVACLGPRHREFDLMVLWFFVLDCVAHPKFRVNAETAAGLTTVINFFNLHTGENRGFFLNTISKLNALFDESVHKVMLKLAMRACRLMLQREILAKEPMASQYFAEELVPKDLQTQVVQLSKFYTTAKKGSEILRYGYFFDQILPNMTSPTMDIPAFEMRLARSLVPIAPYLQCFIEGHDTWTSDL